MVIGSILLNLYCQLIQEHKMNNYNISELKELSRKTKEFYEAFNEAKNWVNENVKHEEKTTLLNYIYTHKSDSKSILDCIETKPVFALFGQSQVGKSYLVKNLLSMEGKNLEIVFPGDKKFDFLLQINPTGNFTESTGVVTRFSLNEKENESQFPVKLTLLDVKDIVLILCDTYYSDTMNHNEDLTTEVIKSHVKNIAISDVAIQQKTSIKDDDIYAIKKYFDTYLKRTKHNAKVLNDSDFWIESCQIVDYISPSQWVLLFEILWGFDKHLSQVFTELMNVLLRFEGNKFLFASTDIILRDKGKILDVSRVRDMLIEEENVKILLENGKEVIVDIHILSALTAEIQLPVDEEIGNHKEFLKYTDLLDFPGARSRKPYVIIEEQVIQNMFLRGKIAYLFNKYSSNYEINNLLFCVKNQQNEVKEIPLLINDWIKFNVGENSEERQRRIGKYQTNPLFIVLTFYNSTLELNPNSDIGDLSHKWENRFIKIFNNEIVSTNKWDEEWTTENPNFQNIYLLRDFTFSDHLFSGFNETKKEIAIKNEEYYERLKTSFLNFPYVKNHFQNPLEAWESATTINQDGTNRIVKDLTRSANNHIKISNYKENLNQYKLIITSKLKKFYFNDDVHEQRLKAVEIGKFIREQLLNLFTKNNISLFGSFLEQMYVSHTRVYNFIHENYLPAKRDHAPSKEEVFLRTYGLDLAKDEEENIKLLMQKLSLSSEQDVLAWLDKNEINLTVALQNTHLSAANKLVDGVIDLWVKGFSIQHFKKFEMHGLDLKVVPLLTDTLIETFEIFQVRTTLIHIFERKTRLMTVSNDTDEYLASICCSYINDFVSNFGFNFMMDERRQNVLSIAKEYNIDTSILLEVSNSITETEIVNIFEEDSSQNDLLITFPVVNQYKCFITKIELILLSNCGFRSYDVKANNELSNIITEIETIEF